MKLKDLLTGVEVLGTNIDPEQNIDAVAFDSRKVTPGCLFVAVTGFAADGNRFIPMALEKGAVAVVTAKCPQEDVPYVLVADDRKALAAIGCNFYGHPADSLCMIGVTGTNGKTSTTLLLKQILEDALHTKVGLIGTMENLIGDEVIPTERTTPESFELQGLLRQMLDAGCTHVVMEVSSHAIALHRVWGITYDIAAFTNLSEDHLDFHKTMEAYGQTKVQLFERCKAAAVNVDDPWAKKILSAAAAPVLTVGTSNDAALRCENVELRADGVRFQAVSGARCAAVSLPIPGRFTVSNALLAMGIASQLDIDLQKSAAALAEAKGVRGRVEVVPTPGKEYTVLIDYAHTPDGLENVLRSLRDFAKGRVITVFGCGGDRDPMKRPIMGEIAARLSDIAVITSDNPRTEDPMQIIRDIVAGLPEEREHCVIIENRRKAIRYAMDIAEKSDIILLAGKGHETYQEICGVKHHLDEREEVSGYLKERLT